MINSFWESEDDEPLTIVTQVREDYFPDIVTQIEVNRRSRGMTPSNIGRGFDKVARDLCAGEYPSQAITFEWSAQGHSQGVTKTAKLPKPPRPGSNPAYGNDTNTTAAIEANPLIAFFNTTDNFTSNSVTLRYIDDVQGPNPPPVLTHFTGTSMESSRFLLLINTAFETFWSCSAQDPIGPQVGREPDAIFSIRNEPWRMEINHFAIWNPDGSDILWGDISAHMIRMLQLPAYLNRWETLESDWFVENKQIATLRIYKLNDPDYSNVNNSNLNSSSTNNSGANNTNVNTGNVTSSGNNLVLVQTNLTSQDSRFLQTAAVS